MVRHRRAAWEALGMLPPAQCSICADEIAEEHTDLVTLGCFHVFHRSNATHIALRVESASCVMLRDGVRAMQSPCQPAFVRRARDGCHRALPVLVCFRRAAAPGGPLGHPQRLLTRRRRRECWRKYEDSRSQEGLVSRCPVCRYQAFS